MNVIDAHNKNFGNIVIFVIGMYGSHKTKFANELASDLNFKHINRDDYVENDINNSANNDVDIDDNINWSKLKQDITSSNNVVVSGSSLPTNKLDVYSHYAIHIKISKQKMIEARINFLKKHNMLKDDSEMKIKKIMDEKTYPYYLNTLQNNKINKFINGNDMDDKKISDEMFSSVIHFIEKKLYKDSTTVTYDDKLKEYVAINEDNRTSAYLKQSLDIDSDVDNDSEYSSSDSNSTDSTNFDNDKPEDED
jgi:shikimate kinase